MNALILFLALAQTPTVIDSWDMQCPGGRCPIPDQRPRQPPPSSPGQMPPLVISASVRVEVYSGPTQRSPLVEYEQFASGMISGGSGTHLGNGLIITNRHVAGRVGRMATVTFQGGKQYRGEVVLVCQYADLAAIHAKDAAAEPMAALAEAVPPAGTAVYSAGYPGYTNRGQGRTLTEKLGRMIGGAHVEWGRSNRIEMRCSSGDSGSGIFDSSGSLVGVLWGGSNGETMACTYADTSRFIKEQCINLWVGGGIGTARRPAQPPITQPPPTPDIAVSLISRLERLESSLSDIRNRPVIAGPPGKDGAPGPPGKDGLPGASGPPYDPAIVNSLIERISALERQKIVPSPATRVRTVPVP